MLKVSVGGDGCIAGFVASDCTRLPLCGTRSVIISSIHSVGSDAYFPKSTETAAVL